MFFLLGYFGGRDICFRCDRCLITDDRLNFESIPFQSNPTHNNDNSFMFFFVCQHRPRRYLLLLRRNLEAARGWLGGTSCSSRGMPTPWWVKPNKPCFWPCTADHLTEAKSLPPTMACHVWSLLSSTRVVFVISSSRASWWLFVLRTCDRFLLRSSLLVYIYIIFCYFLFCQH